MRFLLCVAADFRSGFLDVRRRLGLLALVSAGMAGFTWLLAKAKPYLQIDMTFGDMVVSVLGGIMKYEPDKGDVFRFPAAWSLLLMAVAYVPLSYPYRDLMGFGKSVLVASGSRVSWWLSKCLWVVAATLVSFTVFLALSAGAALLAGGGLSPTISSGLPTLAGFMAMTSPISCDLLAFLAVAFVVVCSLCLLQTALSLVVRPVLSFAFTAALLLASAYVYSPLLLGNYLMVARAAGVAEEAMDPMTGLVLAAAVGTASVIGGSAYFSRMDCVGKEFEA